MVQAWGFEIALARAKIMQYMHQLRPKHVHMNLD
jgi:hypothetical protein